VEQSREECALEAMTQAESNWETELAWLVLTDLHGLTQAKWLKLELTCIVK